MSLFDKKEITAPSIEAAVAEAVKPAEAVVAAVPVNSGSACTRDTRGDASCAVKNCENCN
jgi:hypothetical protein